MLGGEIDPERMSVDELLQRCAMELKVAGNSGSADVHIGRASACVNIALTKIQKRQVELEEQKQLQAQAQIEIETQANELTKELLKSNKQASEQNEKNAALMNHATEQLAKSTSSLKWATWALVAFTAVQALIAFAALYVSMHQSK